MQTPNYHHQSSQLLSQPQQQQQQQHPQQQQQHPQQQQQQLLQQQQQFYQQQHQHQYQQFQNFQQYQLYQQYQQQPLLQQQQQPTKQAHHLNKIICSFKSDLPNEIDFAMQVATLLANSDNFKWSKDHPLIDAICSSLHVFVCICGNSSNCYCYPKFWRKILTKHLKNPFLQEAAAPPDIEQSFLNFSSLRCHEPKDHLKIYKRIKTTAELIKQFSMTISKDEKEEPDTTVDNQQNINFYHETITATKKKKPKASPSLVKFVALLLYCDDVALNLIGLDILSNAASKMAKVQEETCSHLFQMFEEHCVESVGSQDGDIYVIVRSLEIISRLISSSNKRVTANIMSLIVERDLISRLEQFLTSHHDVTLFLAALECCYRVSRHQPHLLVTGRAKYLLKILVILLNCDISTYFTQSALKKVRLTEPDEQTPPSTPLRPLKQVAPAKITTSTLTTSTSTITTTTVTTTTTITTTTNSEPSPEKTTPTKEEPETKETPAPVKEFTCEWNNCNSKFSDAKQVHTHVFETHIEPLEAVTISPCLWSGPNGSGPGCVTKRPKFSLLTHLNDFHCNQVALEHGQSIKPPEHPGYAPNAALLAIRRHANAYPESSNGSKTMHSSQSPLITSVRLTAALILRNLAIESPEMKQALENHEPLLSEICMTNGRDESKIIAECLSLFCSEG